MNKSDYLKPDERLDDLQCKGYYIIQNPAKFCFGMDAVLLSSFAKLKKHQTVLDLGTGTGILPILLSAKTDAKSFDALEIQEESADMATRSVALNHLEERIHITKGDIKEASAIYGRESFHAVVTNPPYMNNHHGLKNNSMPKTIARHEVMCKLTDVIREASLVLKPKGTLYMVHRPFRLAEIFRELSAFHLEPKRMCLVHPYINQEPNMVLIEAVKCAKPMLKIEPPIIVYQEPNVYTPQLLKLYGYENFSEENS